MYRAAHGGDGSVSLSGGDGGDGGVFLSIHSFSQSYNSKANEKSRLSAGCPVSRATVCFLHSHRRPRHRRIYVRSPRFGWGVGKLHFCFLFVYLYCYMCTLYSVLYESGAHAKLVAVVRVENCDFGGGEWRDGWTALCFVYRENTPNWVNSILCIPCQYIAYVINYYFAVVVVVVTFPIHS